MQHLRIRIRIRLRVCEKYAAPTVFTYTLNKLQQQQQRLQQLPIVQQRPLEQQLLPQQLQQLPLLQ